jgi:hypothetical protein
LQVVQKLSIGLNSAKDSALLGSTFFVSILQLEISQKKFEKQVNPFKQGTLRKGNYRENKVDSALYLNKNVSIV